MVNKKGKKRGKAKKRRIPLVGIAIGARAAQRLNWAHAINEMKAGNFGNALNTLGAPMPQAIGQSAGEAYFLKLLRSAAGPCYYVPGAKIGISAF